MRRNTPGNEKNHRKCAIFGGFHQFFGQNAEKEGFEPPEALTPQRFSRPPQSTTLPFLRCKSTKFSNPTRDLLKIMI